MKMNDMFPSNYLKKEDLIGPTCAVIRQVTQEEIQGDGGKELKVVVQFTGNLKPMILNRGNAEMLKENFGDDSDAWHGKTVEVYVDPSVMFAGKRVGGLRLRMPDPRFSGNQNGAANGFASPAPIPAANGFWDIKDGTGTTLMNQSADQVRDFLADCKAPLSTVWIKPSGAPREQAKTADKWNFTTPTTGSSVNDPIPF